MVAWATTNRVEEGFQVVTVEIRAAENEALINPAAAMDEEGSETKLGRCNLGIG